MAAVSDAVGSGSPRLQCAGCGARVAVDLLGPPPFRCPNAASLPDVDHVLRRTVPSTEWGLVDRARHHPFLRYRHRLISYHAARLAGLPDASCVELVERLDRRVAEVTGRGFAVTPLTRHGELEARLGVGGSGALWVKDETGNVSGSHKARHLFGVLLWLELAALAREVKGLRSTPSGRFAIASCGNAALAAAVVAAAARRPLDVFVPVDVNSRIASALSELGATIAVCARRPGVSGDPCYHAFRAAIAEGGVPFCVQGPDNGLTVEGGATIGYELLEQVPGPVDRLFVQVGGGALASACVLAFTEAWCQGTVAGLPRVHAVQTEGAAPLRRAYERVMGEIFTRLGEAAPRGDAARAQVVAERAADPRVRAALAFAATHRGAFMWPWESEPRSLAHGILDDETYDWLAIVEGMMWSGGWPVVVDEATIARANDLARASTAIDVDHTGTAGLAGLLALVDRGEIAVARERVAVIFSGRRR